MSTSQYWRSARRVAVEGPPGDPGKDEINSSQGGHSRETQHTHMGMGDHPVGEMGQPLDIGEGLQGALEAGEQIPDRAGKDKLSPDVGVDISQTAPHGKPEVDQNGHHRDQHAHAARDGHHL